MIHEIQRNFDCSRFVATSPLEKESIIEIAELLKDSFPETIACSDEPSLSLQYLQNESSYLLSEFRKNHPRSSDYTSLGIALYADSPLALNLIFHLSSGHCFLNMRSNVLTLAELEDLRELIAQRISVVLESAQLIDVPEGSDHLETLYSKLMTLPVVDASGNVLNKGENRIHNGHNSRSKTNSENKTPWYKSTWFWGAAGIAATIIIGLVTSFFLPH